MLRSSSRPRTSGFHPEDQGFESPTEYENKEGFLPSFLLETSLISLQCMIFTMTWL